MPFFLKTSKSSQGVDCAGWIVSAAHSQLPGALYAQGSPLVTQQEKSKAKGGTSFVTQLATSSFVMGMSVAPQASKAFLAGILEISRKYLT